MSYYVKVTIAISLIIIGAIAIFLEIRNESDYGEKLREVLLDVIIFGFPEVIFDLILIVVGGGWLYYLLTN